MEREKVYLIKQGWKIQACGLESMGGGSTHDEHAKPEKGALNLRLSSAKILLQDLRQVRDSRSRFWEPLTSSISSSCSSSHLIDGETDIQRKEGHAFTKVTANKVKPGFESQTQ